MAKPLYFYHLVNKDADLSQGLLSLKYMYEHNMSDLFLKYTSKYEKRITSLWHLKGFQGKKSLTNKDYIDALNAFRGPYGSSYIYFFRYAPYKELGPKMAEILKYKDIYRIDINNPKVKKYIKDIFYGFDGSNSDNQKLDKAYYEKVTKEEYFQNYDDNSRMNFASLNHIAIAFKDDYCPKKILEKI